MRRGGFFLWDGAWGRRVLAILPRFFKVVRCPDSQTIHIFIYSACEKVKRIKKPYTFFQDQFRNSPFHFEWGEPCIRGTFLHPHRRV